MRMTLNIDNVKITDVNSYTKQYNERDRHFLCDDPLASDNTKQEKEEDLFNISPYSTIF